jgi:hypothetical protein
MVKKKPKEKKDVIIMHRAISIEESFLEDSSFPLPYGAPG